MYTEALKGVAVISMTEGARVGRVEESLFDPQTLHLAALRIKGDAGEFLVPIAKVQSIGTDAVMVDSSAVAEVSGTATAALLGWDDLKRHQVVDEAGTLIGTMRNLDIDPVTRNATQLVIHKGGFLGLGGETTAIPVEQIARIGDELITVTGGAGRA
jgi:sporulation protein YlmC with PRC-barrel domain